MKTDKHAVVKMKYKLKIRMTTLLLPPPTLPRTIDHAHHSLNAYLAPPQPSLLLPLFPLMLYMIKRVPPTPTPPRCLDAP